MDIITILQILIGVIIFIMFLLVLVYLYLIKPKKQKEEFRKYIIHELNQYGYCPTVQNKGINNNIIIGNIEKLKVFHSNVTNVYEHDDNYPQWVDFLTILKINKICLRK